MAEILKRLARYIGSGGRVNRVAEPALPATPAAELPAEYRAELRPAPGWVLGFDSLLPGMRGHMAVPVGPGRNLADRFDTLSVAEVFNRLGYMVEARERWPFAPEPETFTGYFTVEGPGWDLTALFRTPAPQVEYFAGRCGGAQVTGQTPWVILAQALVLSPDYDAVVAYLSLTPYHMQPFEV